jgi:polyhydroxyalkanoate synthesis regulator phasin
MPEGSERPPERGVGDRLRAAVERTLELAGSPAESAGQTRERATELLDEVARRGREARDELARRGQEAGAGIARRGQEAREELARRLEVLERRLSAIEDTVRPRTKPKAED